MADERKAGPDRRPALRPGREGNSREPSTIGHAAERPRRRALELALTAGFVVFALLALCAWFYAPNRASVLIVFGFYKTEMIAGAGLVVLAGAALAVLARRQPRWGRLCLLAGAGWLLLVALGGLFLSGVRPRVITLFMAAGLFLSAMSLGAFLLRKLGFRPAGGAEGLALAGALGLAALSFVFVLLGQVGLFRGWVLAAAALAAGAPGARELMRLAERFIAEARRALRGAGLVGSTLLVLIGLVYAYRLLYCFSPPTFSHHDYDGLSYHLAAPLEWLESGFVSFLAHNAYANMPAAAEVLYAPGLALAPGSWAGLHFARLVGLGCSELAMLAVYAGARRLAGRRAALAAAALFFLGAWLSDLVVNPYVEPLLLLLATTAWTAFAAAVARGQFDVRRLAVAGLLAGGACATKYPALVFVAAPLAPAALAAGLIRRKGVRRALAGGALAGALALAVAAPWYVRNWIAGGNPVYPLAAEVFGSPAWPEWRKASWKRAHSPPTVGRGEDGKPRPAWRALGVLAAGRRGAGLENLRTGPLLAVFLPLALWGLWRRRRRAAPWLGLFVLIFVAGWAGLTHQVERFLFPAYGGLAILAALGVAELPRRSAMALASGIVLVSTLAAAPAHRAYVQLCRGEPPVGVTLGLDAGEKWLAGPLWQAVRAANGLPAGSKVLLVGEVRRALFRVPVVYSTVWDRHPFEDALGEADAEEAARRLREAGVTHVLCNNQEACRLLGSYGYLRLTDAEKRTFAELELRHLKCLGRGGGRVTARRAGKTVVVPRSPWTGRPWLRYELWGLTPRAERSSP